MALSDGLGLSFFLLGKDLLIIFPLDEKSFRVAAYSFRKLIDYDNSSKYTLIINERIQSTNWYGIYT